MFYAVLIRNMNYIKLISDIIRNVPEIQSVSICGHSEFEIKLLHCYWVYPATQISFNILLHFLRGFFVDTLSALSLRIC